MKKNIKQQPAIFHDVKIAYRADTCEPLKKAAKEKRLILEGFGRNDYPGNQLPEKIMPELCLYCVWDANKDQNWGLTEHRNEGIEIGYLSKGKLDFLVNGKVYPLKSGDLTITRPWQPHKAGDPNIHASRMHWLILDVGVRRPNEPWVWPNWFVFSKQDINKLTELLRYNEQPVWRANQQIEKCFEKIASLTTAKNIESVQTRLRLYINSLFLELSELLQKNNIKLDSNLISTRRSVEMFLAGLKKHLDYQWTLEEMAKSCKLGRSRFSHHCKAITNMTATEYLAHCRIESAKNLLKNYPEKTISQIATLCGFESSQYFATVFKKKTNLSPRQYLQAN
ncbi:MAG TPA: AraC family transcriptional regulator [Sedimentisphaerales bacterium]|nr:AraC family transcriptional regulator [Sedimentisphaerales bacterium]